jgi:short-subunit dehydrogenase
MANRNAQRSQEAAEKLRKEVPGAQIRTIELNLASLKSVRECAKEIIRSEVKLHLLINNAGD